MDFAVTSSNPQSRSQFLKSDHLGMNFTNSHTHTRRVSPVLSNQAHVGSNFMTPT